MGKESLIIKPPKKSPLLSRMAVLVFARVFGVITARYVAECARNPVIFFAILSMQRSGSGWFESLLNSLKNVSSNEEIFSVRHRRENISSIVQTLNKVYSLDWYSSASKNECFAAAGFKWMLNHVYVYYSMPIGVFYYEVICSVISRKLFLLVIIISKCEAV
ncbi:uncharacterized protein [Pyrus communis]|uniref:uncharacterized protein n=1 Tax=Pyrus communis TaxID=23211 RepID=UPI0035BF38BB